MIVEGNLILSIILLFICLIMCYKRVPIAGIPIGIVTIFLCTTVWLFDSDLPTNPYYTLIIAIVALASIFSNALEVRRR